MITQEEDIDMEQSQSIDAEWMQFMTNQGITDSSDDDDDGTDNENGFSTNVICQGTAPEPSDIYISTKSKIAYLNEPINLDIFWDIPVIPYSTPENGIIKKQIKLNSATPEALDAMQIKLKAELFYDEHIINHIDAPNGRIKFKDTRKISIGLSKKDILTYRSKKKQAFYNCFVMILRVKINSAFKEFHIKVFNTGKMEIPGVQNDDVFQTVLTTVLGILQTYHPTPIYYSSRSDTVLINSNFNCGFYIERNVLLDILKYKYAIQAIYDPCCSYPGIQCKFYYDPDTDVQAQTGQLPPQNVSGKMYNKKYIAVSFMIFRTGSVLIVGMCDEHVLMTVYTFIVKILKDEFQFICQRVNANVLTADDNDKAKRKKIRKRTILITTLP